MWHRQLSSVVDGTEGQLSTPLVECARLQPDQIFIRALDLDERLVGVAFLDVGVYVTSLRAMKNLLLIGDAVKSVTFVAFQVS